MVEPFSAVASAIGVVGVLHTATMELHRKISKIKGAPRELIKLRDALEDAKNDFRELENLRSTLTQNHPELAEQWKTAERCCLNSYEQFERELSKWTQKIDDNEFRWINSISLGVRKKRQMKDLREQVKLCNRTIKKIDRAISTWACIRIDGSVEPFHDHASQLRSEVEQDLRAAADEGLNLQDERSITVLQQPDLSDQSEVEAAEPTLSQLDQRIRMNSCVKELLTQLHKSLEDQSLQKISAEGRSAHTAAWGATAGRDIGVQHIKDNKIKTSATHGSNKTEFLNLHNSNLDRKKG